MLWKRLTNAIVEKTLRFNKGAQIQAVQSDGTTSTIDLAELAAIDSIAAADLAKIDGITNGTAAAGKALVADSNVDVTLGLRNFVATGTITTSILDVSSSSTFGSITSSGTIHGSAAVEAGTLAVSGVATVGETLTVTGILKGSAAVSAGSLNVSGVATVGGTLGVTGALTASADALLGANAGVLVGFHGLQVSQAALIADVSTSSIIAISSGWGFGSSAQGDSVVSALNSVITLLKNKGLMASA